MGAFDSVSYNDKSLKIQQDVKFAFENVEDVIERNFKEHSREVSLALTKIEEAYMWLGKDIKRQQLVREVEDDV